MLCSYNILPTMSAHGRELILFEIERIVRTARRTIILEDRDRCIVHVLRPAPEHGGVVHIERPMEWWMDDMPVGIRQLLAGGSKVSRHCLCCSRSFSSAGAHNRLCDDCRTPGSTWRENA
jgi:hypothetical protein